MKISIRSWAVGLTIAQILFALTAGAAIAGDESSDDFDSGLSLTLLSEQIEELVELNEELEDQLVDVEEHIGSRAIAHAFDAVELDLGGFLTQTATGIFGDDSSSGSLDQTLLEILVRAKLSEEWTLFSALGFLRAADVDVSDPDNPTFRSFVSRNPQIITWFNYRASDGVQFQAGRFITPHGIINVEHFPPTLLELNQPQFLRPFPGSTLFPNFLNGVQFHGKQFVGNNDADTLGYHAYVGAATNGDPDDLSVGGRIFYHYADSGATLGFNYSHGSRQAPAGVNSAIPSTFPTLGSLSIVPVPSLTTNEYDLIGADLLYDYGNWLWKTEFFYSYEAGNEDRWAFYTQPARRIRDNLLLFYRYDFLDAGEGVGSSREHVIGLNFLPIPNVRTRAVYLYKRFDNADEDAHFVQLSATVSF